MLICERFAQSYSNLEEERCTATKLRSPDNTSAGGPQIDCDRHSWHRDALLGDTLKVSTWGLRSKWGSNAEGKQMCIQLLVGNYRCLCILDGSMSTTL